MKWIRELPEAVHKELLEDAKTILSEIFESEEQINEILGNIVNEKLVDVIGDEWGLLPAAKYEKYI